MSKTIDAIKKTLKFLKNGEFAELTGIVSDLTNALEQEEAQTVEPVGTVSVSHYLSSPSMENIEFQLERSLPNGVHKLFTHPAPATEPAKLPENCGSSHCSCIECEKPAKPSEGEREAIAQRLRLSAADSRVDYCYSGTQMADLMREAADMLAADAQAISNLLARIHRDGGHYEAEHGVRKALADADLIVSKLNALSDTQQVAVPQGWKLVPVKPTYEMLAAFRDCNIPSGSYAFEDYNDQLDWEHGYDYSAILAAAPQPPQADSKRHGEFTCPLCFDDPVNIKPTDAQRVPMTDDAKRTLAGGYFAESFAIEHALNMLHDFEQFHGIWVKS